MLLRPVPVNLHYRPQLLVGLGLGIWLYLFLVLVGPYDASELSLRIRTILMVGYGLVFFLSYALLTPLQHKLHERWTTWLLKHELGLIIFFCLYSLPLCFAYYKTDLVNGDYTFGEFAVKVYLPTISILMPGVIIGRYLIARNTNQVVAPPVLQPEILTLRGEYKLDILKLQPSDLVAMEAANNYVAVYYLQEDQLKKKLLRSSLRKMHESVPELVRVHRSYLVNAHHFIEWKDGLTLSMTQLSIPVSKKYKSVLLSLPAFAPI